LNMGGTASLPRLVEGRAEHGAELDWVRRRTVRQLQRVEQLLTQVPGGGVGREEGCVAVMRGG
jgi:hypothetical protein